MKTFYDIIVIGAGPAGMAAALAAAEKNPECAIALIEREERTGGILKQCIHDGFGLIRFQKRLTGPEYADRYYNMLVQKSNIDIAVSAFLIRIRRTKSKGNFQLTFTNPQEGIFNLSCTALISATGCRERTDRQVFIHGDRPSGVFTAGQAQAFINLRGYLPGKRFVILGSGDIGLIMARRMTLEGAKVKAVVEIMPFSSGLNRNIAQCLEDYDIPLFLSHNISFIHGKNRIEGVTIAQIDSRFQEIEGTQKYYSCDTLLLSVGLIPENELSLKAQVPLDRITNGPMVDSTMQTERAGIFACGNVLHVHDIVDFVTRESRTAGKNAGLFALETLKASASVPCKPAKGIRYVMPHKALIENPDGVNLFMRVDAIYKNSCVLVKSGKEVLAKKRVAHMIPSEMINIPLSAEKIRTLTEPITAEVVPE